MRLVAILASFFLVAAPSPAAAETAVRLVPPVDAPVARAFDAPEDPYGPGHRGIDYSVPVGTPVRAAGPGTVSFAGTVAGVDAVTIDHGSGIESTYSDLSEVHVDEGARVGEGTWIGLSRESHQGRAGLHFGVKVEGSYVDPTSMLGPIDIAGAIHLVPAFELDNSDLGGLGDVILPLSAGTNERSCSSHPSVDVRRPPNDNVAVAVAGISSHTTGGTGATIYEHGPETLGYPPDAIYRFSYRGVDGPRAHEPYRREDTYIDLRVAAARLRSLLVEVARRHPGSHVDLLAHSQGGVVARAFLTRHGRSWDAALPPIDHLVTFASPHSGAPAAAEGADIERDSLLGGVALDALSSWARSGGPLPDPRSRAVAQLAPGSDFLGSLASEDVGFGTRALALAIPNDLVVPADRAAIPHEPFHIVAPRSVFTAHSGIVTSDEAWAVAYEFLADRAPACPSGWDGERGLMAGRASGFLQRRISDLYGRVEEAAASVALSPFGVPPGYARLVYRGVAGLERAGSR